MTENNVDDSQLSDLAVGGLGDDYQRQDFSISESTKNEYHALQERL